VILIQLLEDVKNTEIYAIYEKGTLFELWYEFYYGGTLKFECDIVMENEVMSGFNMRNINGNYLKVRGVHTVGVVDEKLVFGDSNAYNAFYSAKVNLFQKFLCPTYKSNYSPQVQKILHTNRKGGLIGSFEDDPFDEEIKYIEFDFKKYYTSIFAEMKFLPVVNSFDNFINYSAEMEIEDYSLYFVEKTDDLIDYPFKQFD